MTDAEFKKKIDDIVVSYEIRWRACVLAAEEKLHEYFAIFERDLKDAFSLYSSSGEVTRPTAGPSPTEEKP